MCCDSDNVTTWRVVILFLYFILYVLFRSIDSITNPQENMTTTQTIVISIGIHIPSTSAYKYVQISIFAHEYGLRFYISNERYIFNQQPFIGWYDVSLIHVYDCSLFFSFLNISKNNYRLKHAIENFQCFKQSIQLINV